MISLGVPMFLWLWVTAGLLVLGVLGAIFGALLALASKIFHVETDPRQDAVRELLEYPTLKIKVEEELRKRKIRYLFETQMDRNILTVHIINEYFFEIPLTLETADRTLGLVSYFIHRPEYAHEELPEIRKVWSRQLSRQWEKLTAGTVSTV